MSFEELKKFAISDILSVSGKEKLSRVIDSHISNLIELALVKGAASRQTEIENSYKIGYQEGFNSRQGEVDELQEANLNLDGECVQKKKLIDELTSRIKDLELINFDSELHFDAAKEHIETLQKRIDKALDLAINHGGYDDLTGIINILKGQNNG